jgi:hypothetical protein
MSGAIVVGVDGSDSGRGRPYPWACGWLADLADAEQAGMLVVGSHRHCARRRSCPGSTGERLLRGAASLVAVAPRGLHQRRWGDIRSIGCAFVDTPDGHEALRAAAALAGDGSYSRARSSRAQRAR